MDRPYFCPFQASPRKIAEKTVEKRQMTMTVTDIQLNREM
jgi:hypothetical protein